MWESEHYHMRTSRLQKRSSLLGLVFLALRVLCDSSLSATVGQTTCQHQANEKAVYFRFTCQTPLHASESLQISFSPEKETDPSSSAFKVIITCNADRTPVCDNNFKHLYNITRIPSNNTVVMEMHPIRRELTAGTWQCATSSNLSPEKKNTALCIVDVVYAVDPKETTCDVTVNTSDWSIVGKCKIERVFSYFGMYSCRWYTLNENQQVPENQTELYLRPFQDPESGMQYLSGYCSFWQPIKYKSAVYKYFSIINPGNAGLFLPKVVVEPPLQPTADCPSHVPKVNRTKVVCTCQTEHIGQPAGLLEWRQGSVSIKRGRYGQSELTLTNEDLAGGKNEYTCLLHWVNVSQVYVTIRVDVEPVLQSFTANTLSGMLTVEEFEPVAFSCHISSEPKPIIVLYKTDFHGDFNATNVVARQPKGEKLTYDIQSATCEDQGEYTCAVEINGKISSQHAKSLELQVTCFPRFESLNSEKSEFVLEYDPPMFRELKLPVLLASPPPLTQPSILFLGPTPQTNKHLKRDLCCRQISAKCLPVSDDQPTHFSCVITANNVSSGDLGYYTFRITNKKGSYDITFSVVSSSSKRLSEGSATASTGLFIATIVVAVVIVFMLIAFVALRKFLPGKFKSKNAHEKGLTDPQYDILEPKGSNADALSSQPYSSQMSVPANPSISSKTTTGTSRDTPRSDRTSGNQYHPDKKDGSMVLHSNLENTRTDSLRFKGIGSDAGHYECMQLHQFFRKDPNMRVTATLKATGADLNAQNDNHGEPESHTTLVRGKNKTKLSLVRKPATFQPREPSQSEMYTSLKDRKLSRKTSLTNTATKSDVPSQWSDPMTKISVSTAAQSSYIPFHTFGHANTINSKECVGNAPEANKTVDSELSSTSASSSSPGKKLMGTALEFPAITSVTELRENNLLLTSDVTKDLKPHYVNTMTYAQANSQMLIDKPSNTVQTETSPVARILDGSVYEVPSSPTKTSSATGTQRARAFVSKMVKRYTSPTKEHRDTKSPSPKMKKTTKQPTKQSTKPTNAFSWFLHPRLRTHSSEPTVGGNFVSNNNDHSIATPEHDSVSKHDRKRKKYLPSMYHSTSSSHYELASPSPYEPTSPNLYEPTSPIHYEPISEGANSSKTLTASSESRATSKTLTASSESRATSKTLTASSESRATSKTLTASSESRATSKTLPVKNPKECSPKKTAIARFLSRRKSSSCDEVVQRK